MKRLLLIVVAALFLQSCSTTLYNWGGNSEATSDYENLSYRFYDKQSPESICALVCMYEKVINQPGGTRMVPPPGLCAEYGYLLLMPGTAETFDKHATNRQRRMFSGDVATSFRERGMEMLKKEMALYPESQKFIAPLLKRL